MARTALAVQQMTSSGLNVAMTAANVDGHSVPWSKHMHLRVKNGGGSPITVTPAIAIAVDGQSVTAKTVTVPAGEERSIGNLPPDVYAQSDGAVYFSFSGVTSVTCAAVS
jgi:archaellum component FlaG (FlaF/FlaG flagellin family)